jgi:hypothetical protein
MTLPALALRALTTDEEHAEFREKVRELTGFSPAPELFRRGEVFAAMLGEEQVGGLFLLLTPPFRAIESIPDEAQARLPLLRENPPESFLEIAAVWLLPERRRGPVSAAFWLAVAAAVLGHHRPYALYSYVSERGGLRRLYRGAARALPLYEGPLAERPGAPRGVQIGVDYVPVENFRAIPETPEFRARAAG